LKIAIDCEFNGFGGQLLSMALVSLDGREFYEVLKYHTIKYEPWVEINVVPILLKESITTTEFQQKLQSFLGQYDDVHIIADWPDDIKYFCLSLITGPGLCIRTPKKMTMEVNRSLSADHSKIPHNALEDARALKKIIDNESDLI
jgi:hypothetical protein